MYSEKVMDHFMNPRNVGEIENASGVGTVGNAKCGDIMKVYLKIENDMVNIPGEIYRAAYLDSYRKKVNMPIGRSLDEEETRSDLL